MTLTAAQLAAELKRQTELQAAQDTAPVALAAEQAAQAEGRVSDEQIAKEVAAAKALRELQADAEQARLNALCITAAAVGIV